ncbi:MAG: HdeD family acid-resistance protein [Planctomycetota bacterium]
MKEEEILQEAGATIRHELGQLKRHWWWLTLLGILLSVCGVVAIAYPFLSSVTATVALGVILLICGVATVVSSFWAGKWSGFLLELLVGILYIVLGLAITDAPVESAIGLTFVAACLFIVAGLFRVTASLVLRFPQWGWALLNGVVTTLLGLIILRHFPNSGLWLVGVLVGVDLLFNGVAWIMLSLSVRELPAD